MKYKIKHRLEGTVLFSLETHSLKLCVEAAVKSGADLSGANLYRAKLSGADLSGANLYRANLYRAKLSGANLYRANLYRANLSRANLYRADLSGADLSGADLSGAKINDQELVGKDPICTIGYFGSANRQTMFMRTKNGIYVQCGCWFGSIADFVKQVKKTHKRNQYAKEYLAAVELIKIRFKRK